MLGNLANPPAHLSGWVRENEHSPPLSQLNFRGNTAHREGIAGF